MTIKELKERIKDLPDDYQVCYEYDGPDTLVDLEVCALHVSEERRNIVLIADKERQ